MAELLSKSDLETSLAELPGWQVDEDGKGLVREFKFKDFSAAFAFMTRSAMAAEQLNHHPEWSNVYNKVEVRLSTHSEGGITDLDIKMAKKMNSFA